MRAGCGATAAKVARCIVAAGCCGAAAYAGAAIVGVSALYVLFFARVWCRSFFRVSCIRRRVLCYGVCIRTTVVARPDRIRITARHRLIRVKARTNEANSE